MQLQLKLTNGPKKSALELIRKNIEMQNEHVLLARSKHQAARKVHFFTTKSPPISSTLRGI